VTQPTERRITPVRVEVRSGDTRTIGGYAAKFNAPSQNLGGFREFIAPGAFNRAASQGWQGAGSGVVARYNHDDNYLLGNSASGTLRLALDDTGLRYEVDTPNARADVFELIQRGDVRQSSFAFMADDDDWTADESGFPVRTLLQVRLFDVAPVNTPAYLDTSVGLRSLARKFDASYDEVRTMAERNELSRFFKRSDGGAWVPAERAANDAQDANVITQAMALFTAIDNIVDEAQETLAAYLGVPNPDTDEADDATEGRSEETPEVEAADAPESVRRSAAAALAKAEALKNGSSDL
jgi:HK97 family phage prohead protease